MGERREKHNTKTQPDTINSFKKKPSKQLIFWVALIDVIYGTVHVRINKCTAHN